MTIDAKYRTSATAIVGHDGRAFTEDKVLDLELATPRELGGRGGDGTNPEQLFPAGHAASFLGAVHPFGGPTIARPLRANTSEQCS